jgi:hypothetical protein
MMRKRMLTVLSGIVLASAALAHPPIVAGATVVPQCQSGGEGATSCTATGTAGNSCSANCGVLYHACCNVVGDGVSCSCLAG